MKKRNQLVKDLKSQLRRETLKAKHLEVTLQASRDDTLSVSVSSRRSSRSESIISPLASAAPRRMMSLPPSPEDMEIQQRFTSLQKKNFDMRQRVCVHSIRVLLVTDHVFGRDRAEAAREPGQKEEDDQELLVPN